jgi:hypothetical protein
MLCVKLSSCLCLLPWDGQVVITHETISVRNFIATGGQQTTQVSQQLVKTSHVLTPYLFDTVTAYFEVCDALWNHSLSITAENILKALNGSGPLETHPCFQGCTGLAAIDSTTGSQSVNDQTTSL